MPREDDEIGSKGFASVYAPCEQEHAVEAEGMIRVIRLAGVDSEDDESPPCVVVRVTLEDGRILELMLVKSLALKLGRRMIRQAKGVF